VLEMDSDSSSSSRADAIASLSLSLCGGESPQLGANSEWTAGAAAGVSGRKKLLCNSMRMLRRGTEGETSDR
jgi:hypothetical protein